MSLSWAEINYWAVGVSAVAAFLVGGLWYGLLFARTWVTVNGYTEEQTKRMQKKQPRNFAIFLVSNLVMAVAISLLVANLDVSAAPGPGATLGVLLWLAAAAGIAASKNAANGSVLAAPRCHGSVAPLDRRELPSAAFDFDGGRDARCSRLPVETRPAVKSASCWTSAALRSEISRDRATLPGKISQASSSSAVQSISPTSTRAFGNAT